MNLMKENGYVLPSVLLISLLISTILLSLITIISFTVRGTIRIVEKKKVEITCLSAVQMVLADSNLQFPTSIIVVVDSISVQLETKRKGLFKEIIVSAKGYNDSSKVRYVLGVKGNVNSVSDYAILFSKPNIRATIAGNTEIVGDILSTAGSIAVGNIYGEPATFQDYHNGVLKKNIHINQKPITDSIFNKLLLQYNDYQKLSYKNDGSFPLQSLEYLQTDTIHSYFGELNFYGSFKSKSMTPLRIKSHCKIEFSEGSYLKKNVEFLSDSLVIIKKNSHLENVIIYSKGPILIEENSFFKNVQLFSADSIFIKSSRFDYPSIICLDNTATHSVSMHNAIVLENCTVNGSVLLLNKFAGLGNNKTKIKIDKESVIHGFVYCENNLELYGKILGAVYTYNFLFVKYPNEYINWLVNVKVDRKRLDEWFLLPAEFNKEGRYKILKEEWFY